jgi:hypothetical protein
MRFLATTILSLLALAVGSEATAAAATTAQLPPARAFSVVYERSGGLAASRQSLRVSPGGYATAESSGTRAGAGEAMFRLGGRRIRSLQRGLRRADIGSIPERQGGCADCYLYSITYEGTSLELEETEVPPRLGRVFDQLDAVITAHTVPPNARSAQG